MTPLPPFLPLVLEALAGHGLRPRPDTPVELLRDQVNDLYRYEIRQLRGRLLAGEIPKARYADAVRTLRTRYLLLSLPRDRWRTT
ncbi:MAG TPA: hypothetical protein VMF13_20275 [Luteitalea sp.]|nr:hypothetical protein [Luteitalea sp.]